ncbi:DNA repair protein RecO [Tenuifilum thalassicum]|uniref:DNA repair protein RecO n=1 Tax=Tenuifilum thalassicum TaxID=2590900 RepID=A0A7D4C1Z0_9BACT|nr:DNA repair protein RecO [Tenuifilum thalassicum]QKG81044.1 DNA repair protein RecO [Tenuifilum thalassicum]
MLAESRVVVLRTVRYKENSLIVSCYSRDFGRTTLLVNRAFQKGRKAGLNVYFQPLTVLDTVFYNRPNTEVHRLKELGLVHAFGSLHQDPIKLTISVFISELIYRTVKEEEPNPHLFTFIENSIVILDHLHSGISNFHLIFMVQLARYLGFYPINSWTEDNCIFDYKNGKFTNVEPANGFYLCKSTSQLLGEIMKTPMLNADKINLNRKQRNEIIEGITAFYRFHLGSGIRFKTLPILNQLFN